jgi:hypothetical protein
VRVGSTIFWHPATLILNPPISTFPANGDVRFDYNTQTNQAASYSSLVKKWSTQFPLGNTAAASLWIGYTSINEHPMHVYEVRPRKDKRGVDLI